MYILGISCFYHDSAACLLKDGKIVSACQEERFSRIKHDWHFPRKSIQYCLDAAGISVQDIDAVAFYEKPFIKFERMLETFLAVAPRALRSFTDSIPSWITQKLRMPAVLRHEMGFRGRLIYGDHHLSHAASAYFASPFDEAAILTIDGVGEWATSSFGFARGNRISLTHEMKFPDSLGLLYSAITSFLGFAVNNDEYKVMGMAPYGVPEYYNEFAGKLVKLNADGSIRLNLEYFEFQFGRRMFSVNKLSRLFGVQPRLPGSDIIRTHFNIAASLQRFTEDVMLRMAGYVRQQTGIRDLCMAGGVALNSVANGRLMREGIFDNIFIYPAAGDSGGAVGAAYIAWYLGFEGKERHPLVDMYLGPEFGEREIMAAVLRQNMRVLADDELFDATARLLSRGKVVGWFQGRMEFGPRALGNRSILADPRRTEMKDIVNSKIKFRESFRPFAPVVTEEDAARYFHLDRPSPYMLYTVPVLSKDIPAVTHIDGSARVQTVSKFQNAKLHSLLKRLELYTGTPILMNTSLNIKGEPIARTPRDAVHCYMDSDMDALIMGNVLLEKNRQKHS